MAGVNLIFYFACKSYRLSFSSVFRSVLKVTEIETHVWVNQRYIALGVFPERQLQGLLRSSFFLHGNSAVWAQVTWYVGLVRCLPRSGIYLLITFAITCVIRREGREKRTRKTVGGFFSASRFRFCFDMNPKIQTFL